MMLLATGFVWPDATWAQAPPTLVEPEQIFSFGNTWRYLEGTLAEDGQWPLGVDGLRTDDAAWSEGSAPFIARSETVQREVERQRRRRRRRGRSVSEFTGTMLVYDPAEYPSPPDPPERYEPGPNTYLFATEFEVDDLQDVVSVFLELRFSGGFVAYLNGRQWLRHNVNFGRGPDDPADIIWLPHHIAQTAGQVWHKAYLGLPSDRIVPGRNTLVVEVHRRGTGGESGLYLDGQLRVYRNHGFIKTPYLQQVTEDAVTVMWETTAPGLGYVEYGAGERLERVATSPRIATTLAEVTLTDLQPDTRYFYRTTSLIADDSGTQVAVTSPIHHFRTAAPPGQPFTFLLYGDNRTNSGVHHRLIDRMQAAAERLDARFFLNTGDVTTHGAIWDEWQDEFFEPALPMLAYLPLYAALGNHEGNHEAWYQYMALPNNESWYQFSYGDADFFALNTSTTMTPGSPQRTWLQRALAESDALWKIAFFHHPPYSCVPSRKPGSLLIQEHIVPLFAEYGVDLVLLGHDHLYGRSFPLDGVTYVISGGGGASTYPAEADRFNEICVQTHHYCTIDVTSDAIELRAIDLEGGLIDAFTLTH